MPTLLQALDEKYGLATGPIEQASLVAIFIPKKPPRLTIPELLVLNDCDIDTAGNPEELKSRCRAVKELDLAQNKLTNWAEVFGIIQHMPKVEFVNLSFNGITGQIKDNGIRLEQLSNIVLNSTKVDWINIHHLLNLAPNLEELHLSLNEYKCIQIDYLSEDHQKESQLITERCTCFSNSNRDSEDDIPNDRLLHTLPHDRVRKLHFTGNPVSEWSEVNKLGRVFPKLESLVLAECPISTLEIQETSDKVYRRSESEPESSDCSRESPHSYFRNLTFLNLNSTLINTWDAIDRLARFPALKSLRVQNWPLWERCDITEHERRQMLLARLPQITTLNGGGAVGDEEREDAERAFIRYYQDRAEADRPERYSELVAIHGKLDPLVNVDLRPEKRVKVTFTCANVSEIRSVDVYSQEDTIEERWKASLREYLPYVKNQKQPVPMKNAISQTVIDLKSRLERLAGIPASKMRLFYVDQECRDHGPEEMKFPHKQLYSYNIRSGDEIIIDIKQKN